MSDKNVLYLSDNFIVREMVENDIPAVYDLECDSFISPWSLQSFVHEFYNANTLKYVVTDDKLIAYIFAWQIVDEIHIANVAVNKWYQKRGIASSLVKKILDIGVERKCISAFLEVRASNTSAIELYKKFDFFQIGQRKNYYTAENEDALVMMCELNKR